MDGPALMLRKSCDLFRPRPPTHCHTIMSRLVSSGGSSGRQLEVSICRPEQRLHYFWPVGQTTGRAAGPQGVGNFEGAPEGLAQVPAAWEAGREGHSPAVAALRLGPSFGPTSPTPRSTRNHSRAWRGPDSGVTGTGCWLELHGDPQRIC